ncbi:Dll3p, partial [Cichlidogyrus casuarinus]
MRIVLLQLNIYAISLLLCSAEPEALGTITFKITDFTMLQCVNSERCTGNISVRFQTARSGMLVEQTFDLADWQSERSANFHKPWPGLVMVTLSLNSSDSELVSRESLLFPRGSFQNIKDNWTYISLYGRQSLFTMTAKVECLDYHYGQDCAQICKPETCLVESNFIKCKPGWRGANCQAPICSPNCSSSNGYCDQPGECKCKRGWTGNGCNECVPYDGCLNGGCKANAPFTCDCDPGWTGALCNIESHYCRSNNSCVNGGVCLDSHDPLEPFRCICPNNQTGSKCEL